MFRYALQMLRRLREKQRMARYDDFTIAEHFRAQGARIGENCRLLVRSLSAEPFLISIGNHCTVAPGVRFVTHDGGSWVFTDELPTLQKFGAIEIHDNCFIGVDAIIMPNVHIGPNAIVAAGAVVTKDVPPNTVVGGCPAKKICSLDEYKQKLLANWSQQRPPGYMADLKDGVHYSAAHIQTVKHRDWNVLRRHLERLFWNR